MYFRRSFVFLIVLSFLATPWYGTFVTPVQAATTDPCNANIAGETHAQLQADLDACNADIANWTNVLNSTKQESASYARDVAALTAKINAATANIKAKNIAIADLGKDITQKQQVITGLDNQIETGRNTLADLIRKANDLDNFSTADAVLSDKNLSDFFVDVDSYASTDRALEDVFAQLRGTKTETQAEKDALAKQQAAATDAKAAIVAAQKLVQVSQAQQKALLADSQNKEKTYAQTVAAKQAEADTIRAALFPLANTAAIPFGTALQYATEVSQKTGVTPAFLLAIMTQESNLGANVGACLVTDQTTGAGKGANTGTPKIRVMSPSRDIPVFLDITRSLNMDPLNTRVSCWQPLYDSSRSPIGWGGAMGAAQFIPSTWKLFAPRIATMSGDGTPNPWNARDAFFASGIYLSDLGAGTGSYTDQRNAACKYYSGKSCASGPGASYGDSVMSHAATIQTTMIDPLQGI